MFNDDDDERSARKSSLKGLLKAFKGKGELRALAQELRALRVQLQQCQPVLKQAVYELPGRNVPLILCSNPARSGISYLRWRNLDNNRSGSVALQEAIQQPDVTDELRDALMALEWRRQVLNTQLSVVMFMLRRIQPLTALV
ncbi:DUF3158 family protein [Salmonella enterica subsp. salamae]|uniref:DUF3158 family protein n=1 Tax=Klebsiella oxytoca TaxID=571 RepID=UPI0012842BC6|nr:DUF3158 family protein [Klebsiella oxytoca]ECG8589572.1 DUF3158 family protein [Salmonella enterica subsp. salamae]ECJ2282766.1 DUF3158 family protein [Salmonella enterica subsp. salamae]MCW9569804.1 DUF3158 family protein [Klebsiella oxytoca]